MPIDTLPGEIIVKSRDRVKQDFLRSYKLRQPDANTSPGTAPDIDAATVADQMVPVYANAQTIGRNILLKNATGDGLDEIGESEIGPRNGPSRATGFVVCSAAATGGTIFDGDELQEPNTGLLYECALTGLYNDGDLVPVRSRDTGVAVNLESGVALAWSSPRPGIGPTVTVYEQTDGTGLTGGAPAEDDDTYRERIRQHRIDPAASGNSSEYIEAVEDVPGISIDKAFAYPAIYGPGTIAVAFTVRPQSVGSSRLPSAIQISDVEGYVTGALPGDDSAFFLTLLDDDVTVSLDVEWSGGTGGWADIMPWPPRYEQGAAPGAPGRVIVTTVIDATHFTLATDNTDYTGVLQPVVGQTIAFYDSAKRKFRRKKVLSFTGTGPWAIMCDTADRASDTEYTPVTTQQPCPWSDALDSVVAPVLAYFRTFGPGEQVASFPDDGYRQRRYPRPPKLWPIETSNRMLEPIFDLDTIHDVVFAEGLGVVTTVGTLGTTAYLMRLAGFTIFPKA